MIKGVLNDLIIIVQSTCFHITEFHMTICTQFVHCMIFSWQAVFYNTNKTIFYILVCTGLYTTVLFEDTCISHVMIFFFFLILDNIFDDIAN